MTESAKAIRNALAAAPTPGPWKLHAKYLTDVIDVDGRMCVARCLNVSEVESNARFIAACNPVAITELLARLEAAEADAARYRWLRHGDNDEIIIAYADDPDPFSWLPRSDKLDAAIDAARAQEAA